MTEKPEIEVNFNRSSKLNFPHKKHVWKWTLK